jgi:hypothetical protein
MVAADPVGELLRAGRRCQQYDILPLVCLFTKRQTEHDGQLKGFDSQSMTSETEQELSVHIDF